VAVRPSGGGLAQLALIRRQELDGFVEGLFSGSEELDLPTKASAALDTLGEVRAMIAGVHEVAIDPSKPAELSDIATTMKHLRELTRITEIEINRVVLDCTRARRQVIGSASNSGPRRHCATGAYVRRRAHRRAPQRPLRVSPMECLASELR